MIVYIFYYDDGDVRTTILHMYINMVGASVFFLFLYHCPPRRCLRARVFVCIIYCVFLPFLSYDESVSLFFVAHHRMILVFGKFLLLTIVVS